MQITEILVRNGFFPVYKKVEPDLKFDKDQVTDIQMLGTVLSNFAYFGFAPSYPLLVEMSKLGNQELIQLWEDAKMVFSKITGAEHKIASHVLYKNFPKEVLDMSTSEYWFRQMFVYLGVPYEWVAQKEADREEIDVELSLKVLAPSYVSEGTSRELELITNALMAQNTRWSNEQSLMITSLQSLDMTNDTFKNLNNYGFKENGILLIKEFYNQFTDKKNTVEEFSNKIKFDQEQLKALMKTVKKEDKKSCLEGVVVSEATDVLRLANALSNNCPSLRGKVVIETFNRPDRQALLSMLENSKNLLNDVSERPNDFKKLFGKLRPGDYKNKFPSVVSVYNELYNKNTISFNALLEAKIKSKDKEVLDLLSSRTGVFIRRFHNLYSVLGFPVVKAFSTHMEKMTNLQLVKFKKYIQTINEKENLLIAPGGKWEVSKIVPNQKVKIKQKDINALSKKIDKELAIRLKATYGKGFAVSEDLVNLKIQSNDQKLAMYGRGTTFSIPENIKFLRTSSFWDSVSASFLDNTWNFFDKDWNSKGVCCWSDERFKIKGRRCAIFSGDAVNRESGKAAQLIDLYLDELQESGVRYAVWSTLSYSSISFDEFNDAHAGMQMGESPIKGKLFEPSRVNFSFPLTEKGLTKIIAYIDIEKREVVYCDVNKKLDISSGNRNQETLSEYMPEYVSYLNTLPSYYDLLEGASAVKGIPAMFSDKECTFEDEVENVFIFKAENAENIYANKIDFSEFLAETR